MSGQVATEQDCAPAADERVRKINLIRGEHRVSAERDVVLTTLLGSCVAACMHDPERGVGGMNHFLLPGDRAEDDAGSVLQAVHAMELLVNALLRQGARRDRLRAKLFGGARLVFGLTDVGAKNAAFAEEFLRREGIRAAGGSLRGEQGRRVQFWPVSGRARQIMLDRTERVVFETERRAPAAAPPRDSGVLELF